MIIRPATILNEFEYSSNKFPINEAVAPKEIKTSENPSENKIVLSKIFFCFQQYLRDFRRIYKKRIRVSKVKHKEIEN